MNKKIKNIIYKEERKCVFCGKKLKYTFEENCGICEDCQIGKKQKIKKFEQKTMITKFKIFESFGFFADADKSEVAIKILHILAQIQMYHWQTDKMAHHKTFDEFYNEFKEIADNLIEVIQGKYGRIMINVDTYMPLRNLQELEPYGFVEQCIKIFKVYQNNIFKDDQEISALLDEIIALLQKLKYLLTFI